MSTLDAIDAAVGLTVDQRPQGSITAIEYAAHKKIPIRTARDVLARAEYAGRLSSEMALVSTGRGLRTMRCYFAKQAKTKGAAAK